MNLSHSEASVLVDTIDQAIEGHRESKEFATYDPMFKTPEDLVEYMHDTDNTIDTLKSVREKVSHGVSRTHAR